MSTSRLNRIGSPLAALALLALATALAYANHFDNGFHFDDTHVIVDNAYVRDLDNLSRFFSDPATKSTLPTNRAYRPVLMASYAVDYALAGGYDPFWFHLTSFLMFLAQGGCMWVLFRLMFDRAGPHRWNVWVATLAVGLYWLHTVNAETVNYISARSDILSTLCVVGAFVIELKARGPWRQLTWLVIIAGALAKPTAVMYVPLLYLYRVLFERNAGLPSLGLPAGRRAWGGELVRILPGAILALLAFGFIHWMTPETWTPGGRSVWQYLITQPFVLLRYFGNFFVPVGLSADSDWALLDSAADARLWIGLVFLLVSLAAFAWTSARKSWRPAAFGLAWFFIALAPSSSVIPLAEVTNDHRMYFPFVGLTMAVAWALALSVRTIEISLGRHRSARIALGGALLAVFGAHALGVHARNDVWHDSASLWGDVVRKSPRNGRGLMNYGLTKLASGDFEGALDLFERARRTSYASHAYLHVNLAIAKSSLGRNDEAEADFERALELGPGYPETHYHYGKYLWQQGRHRAARRELARTLELAPGHAPARRWLNWIEEQSTARVEAAANTARKTPTARNQLDLSLALFEAGRYQDSADAAHAAIAMRPDYPQAWNNVCSALNALGSYTEAIAACERAIELAPDYELAKNNLAWARRQLQQSAAD